MLYQLIDSGQTATLVLHLDDALKVIPRSHANFTAITDYVTAGGTDHDHVRRLLDVRATITRNLTKLSERVSFDGHQIRFDGDPLDTALSRHILRLLREGENFRSAVLFMENLADNPSPLSRMHLWKWIADRDFTLTDNGEIIGYKAVRNTPDNLSITHGDNEVYVNGTPWTGNIPNPIGATVEIARAAVDPSRDHGCSAGLHVGTHRYARSFGGSDSKLLIVSINPRDVVAVPRDCDSEKMRVCRYTVREARDLEYDTAYVAYPDDEEDCEAAYLDAYSSAE